MSKNLLSGLFDGQGGEGGGEENLSDLLRSVSTTGMPSISELVDSELVRMQKEGWSRDSYGGWMRGYHASFVVNSDCPRALMYHKVSDQAIEEFPPRTLRIFGNGNDVHSRIQSYLHRYLRGTWICARCHSVHNAHELYLDYLETYNHQEYERVSESTVSLSSEPEPVPEFCLTCDHEAFLYDEWRVIDLDTGLSGKADGILRLPEETEDIVLEIKSSNARSFGAMGPLTPLMLKYKKQIGLYMNALRISRGVILVENKNTQELAEYPVTLQELSQYIKPILSNMERVNHVLLGHAPEPRAVRVPECGHCPYFGNPCHPVREESI